MPKTAAGDFFLILECQLEPAPSEVLPSESSSRGLAPDIAGDEEQSSDIDVSEEIERSEPCPTLHLVVPLAEVQVQSGVKPSAIYVSVDSDESAQGPDAAEEADVMRPVDLEAVPVERNNSEENRRRRPDSQKPAESAEHVEAAASASASADALSLSVEAAIPVPDAETSTRTLPDGPDSRTWQSPVHDASRQSVTRQLAVQYEPAGLEQRPGDRTARSDTTAVGFRHSQAELQPDPGQLSFAARIHLRAAEDVRETRPPAPEQAVRAGARAKAAAPRPAAAADSQLHLRVEPFPEQRVVSALEERRSSESQLHGSERSRDSRAVESPSVHRPEETAAHLRPAAPKAVPVIPTSVAGSGLQSVRGRDSSPKPLTPVAEPASDARLKAPAAREIQLSVSDGDRGDIHLKLVERAGKLHIAVRSPQPELASRMQQDVGKLVSRLRSEFGHTESWTPGKDASTGVSEAEHGSSTGGGAFHDDHERNDAAGGEGRRRQDERERPEWVNEFLGERRTGKRFREEVLEWLKAYRR